MTTSAHPSPAVAWAQNLFEPNDIVEFDADSVCSFELGAVSMIHKVIDCAERDELMWDCVERLISMVLSTFPGSRVWLCVLAGGVDSPITRKRGILGSLSLQDFDLSPLPETGVVTVEEEGGLLFFGGFDISDKGAGFSQSLITPLSRSFLIVLPTGVLPDIEMFIARGWAKGMINLGTLQGVAEVAANLEGFLIRPFGQFDDREVGADCLMAVEHLSTLRYQRRP